MDKGQIDGLFLSSCYIPRGEYGSLSLMADLCERKHWNGLLHFYPCLDDEKFESYGLKRKPFTEKENIMVCVGRIGCYQKNTEMLLNALRKVDLKDWKIYMLGPITSSFNLNEDDNFQKTIDTFLKNIRNIRVSLFLRV